MTRPRRLLTVCLGNHCRSPLAAVILAHRGGPHVEVRSAGIRGKWAGHPAHPMMTQAAADRGWDLTEHRGVPLTPALLQWADLVLAMDTANLTALNAPGAPAAPHTTRYLDGRDVPDPYGQGPDAFAAVVRLLEDGAARHLQ
ncbi:Low molecular weight protein-tyrosine-phosphatase etp [Streptomyces sp. YIM 130001]|uniref:low molecular weight protein-tyrosine-phosphatase n=1 Tax=Streptomyces sp. YIM 130001 TaxID=2259644 RepID=UPI000E65AB6B|nr:low molecular weight protein-tyrosine-phosphatase [Streptomyces sp. YIM 130001]RII07990.1 Low molecular weight protein-tyrosine-phosphatase etp [Streptomyces sp. YIM 130001]